MEIGAATMKNYMKDPQKKYMVFPDCNAGDPSSIPGSQRFTGEGIGYPLQYSWASNILGSPTCNVGDLGSIPGLERSPGERNSYSLQYFGLENSMNSVVHGVTKSWT